MTAQDVRHIRATLDYLIFRIIQMEHVIMANQQDMIAKIERAGTVDDSVLALITTLSQQLKDAAAKGDMSAVEAAISNLDTRTDAIVAAVSANTPAADPDVQTQG